MRRKQTIEENVNYFCKRNNLNLTLQQKNQIKKCFSLYGRTFSSKSKLHEYLKYFIEYDLKCWSQRLKRLSKLNLKSVTKKKFLLLYGKNEALKKWKKYTYKQAYTNSYNHKKQKYGWNKNDFIKYNKSRAITIENLINKYGEKIGEEKYNSYINKQKHCGNSLEYFIEKYGENGGVEYYNNLCEKKSNTLQNFIKRYGENDGKLKYRNYLDSRKNYFSKSSQELFWKIKTKNCYFAEYNKEYGILSGTQYYFYDYVDTKLKKCIEYNGDYWHCNPKIYHSDYNTHYGYTAKEIWEKDQIKIDTIKNLGYDVMVVWESDYLNSRDKIIKLIEDFLDDKN